MSNYTTQDLQDNLNYLSETKTQIKQAITDKGQVIADTDTFRSYAQKIKDISSGVKLFETEEAMQADPSPKVGDLATVYKSTITNATVDSQFSQANFPDTVVLPTAITDYVEVRYRAVDTSVMFDCMINLDANNFIMDCFLESGQIEINYTSTDGKTYTRTDTTGNPVDFGTQIYYERAEMWNDAIGYFIQVSGYDYKGLFQYTNIVDGNTLKVYKDIHSTDSTITGTEYELDMRPYTNKILELVDDTSGSAKMIGIIGLNGHIYMVRTYADRYTLDAAYIANQLVLNIGQGTGTRAILQSLDGSDNITLELNTNSNIYRLHNGTKSYYYEGLTSIEFLGNVLVYQNKLTNSASGFSAQTYLRSITNQTNDQTVISSINDTLTPVYKLTYVSAPTQLTTISNDVYKSIFYGKNGVETGTLTKNISDSFVDLNAKIYSEIQNAYDSMEPRVLTDNNKTIDKTTYIIPTKLDGTPLLDTSNVTGMSYMFSDCKTLTTIPLLNTSNVTEMIGMFETCKALTSIPLLDTSNVTYMSNMFYNCTSLSNDSLNNILAMCTNATAYTGTKTLKVIGLTSAQADICKNLSNYSAFTNAGWTTGY